ncbi:hypothetical protein Tco_0926560 [Tanacetum coccineum]|uniref:Uncharacterized protein n=1 Tax=Tanacetum coccineum TaxID=301880 RepID=A0ABQ5DA89_9ASTR
MVEDLRYFNSLEKEVESLKSQLQRQKIEFSKSTDRLLEEYFSKDLMCAILCYFADIDECIELQCLYLEKCQECESLEIELTKSKTQQFDKRFANLEQHCINLELALQHEKEKNVLFEKHLEEKHMNWARFGKSWRRRQKFNQTSSGSKRDGITTNRQEEPFGRFGGLTASGNDAGLVNSQRVL